MANPGRTASRDPLRLHLGGNNNGSAFAGLSANTPFYNTLLGVAMWLGRFGDDRAGDGDCGRWRPRSGCP
jgi:K+-transporting ATPase ATPase A chain